MSKEITINYHVNTTGISCTVLLFYTIEVSEDTSTLCCIVEATEPNLLPWLQIRRFEIKSSFYDGGYAPLFNEQNNIRTVDAALFIDDAYKAIMTKEKLRVHTDAFAEA